MTDTLVDPERSALMAKVRSKDTKPELRVRRFLHSMGLRFRIHRNDLPGKPDLVFVSRKTIVFVHGCFWHRHPGCKHTRSPKSRRDFWEKKFSDNIKRDIRVREELESLGWRVVVVWECETKERDQLTKIANKIASLPVQRS